MSKPFSLTLGIMTLGAAVLAADGSLRFLKRNPLLHIGSEKDSTRVLKRGEGHASPHASGSGKGTSSRTPLASLSNFVNSEPLDLWGGAAYHSLNFNSLFLSSASRIPFETSSSFDDKTALMRRTSPVSALSPQALSSESGESREKGGETPLLELSEERNAGPSPLFRPQDLDWSPGLSSRSPKKRGRPMEWEWEDQVINLSPSPQPQEPAPPIEVVTGGPVPSDHDLDVYFEKLAEFFAGLVGGPISQSRSDSVVVAAAEAPAVLEVVEGDDVAAGNPAVFEFLEECGGGFEDADQLQVQQHAHQGQQNLPQYQGQQVPPPQQQVLQVPQPHAHQQQQVPQQLQLLQGDLDTLPFHEGDAEVSAQKKNREERVARHVAMRKHAMLSKETGGRSEARAAEERAWQDMTDKFMQRHAEIQRQEEATARQKHALASLVISEADGRSLVKKEQAQIRALINKFSRLLASETAERSHPQDAEVGAWKGLQLRFKQGRDALQVQAAVKDEAVARSWLYAQVGVLASEFATRFRLHADQNQDRDAIKATQQQHSAQLALVDSEAVARSRIEKSRTRIWSIINEFRKFLASQIGMRAQVHNAEALARHVIQEDYARFQTYNAEAEKWTEIQSLAVSGKETAARSKEKKQEALSLLTMFTNWVIDAKAQIQKVEEQTRRMLQAAKKSDELVVSETAARSTLQATQEQDRAVLLQKEELFALETATRSQKQNTAWSTLQDMMKQAVVTLATAVKSQIGKEEIEERAIIMAVSETGTRSFVEADEEKAARDMQLHFEWIGTAIVRLAHYMGRDLSSEASPRSLMIRDKTGAWGVSRSLDVMTDQENKERLLLRADEIRTWATIQLLAGEEIRKPAVQADEVEECSASFERSESPEPSCPTDCLPQEKKVEILRWVEKVGISTINDTGPEELIEVTHEAPSLANLPDDDLSDRISSVSGNVVQNRRYQLDALDSSSGRDSLVPDRFVTKRNPPASGNVVQNRRYQLDALDSSSERDPSAPENCFVTKGHPPAPGNDVQNRRYQLDALGSSSERDSSAPGNCFVTKGHPPAPGNDVQNRRDALAALDSSLERDLSESKENPVNPVFFPQGDQQKKENESPVKGKNLTGSSLRTPLRSRGKNDISLSP